MPNPSDPSPTRAPAASHLLAARFGVILLGLVGPLYLLVAVLSASRLPYFDYWVSFQHLIAADGSITWRGLLEPINEHYIIIPKLIYLANIGLADGSNRSLAGFVFLLAAAQAFVLWSAVPGDIKRSPIRHATALALILGLSFPLLAAHNFLRGMSGACWITANLFAMLALRAADRGSMVAALSWATASSASYATGVAVWPVLWAVVWIAHPQRRRLLIVLGVLVVAAVGFYALAFRRPSHHPAYALDPLAVLALFAFVVGGFVLRNGSPALLTGAMGLLAAASLWYRELFLERRLPIFWLGIAAYSVGAILLIAVGRAAFPGFDTSYQGRYATLPALLWLTLAIAWLASALQSRIPPGALCGLLLAVHLHGAQELRLHDRAQRGLDIAGIGMRFGLAPPELAPNLTPDATTLLFNKLSAVNHYPLNDDFPMGCPALGSLLRPDATLAPEAVAGWVDACQPTARTEVVHLKGWAAVSGRPVECVSFVDEMDNVVGSAIPGEPRPDVRRALGAPEVNFGWEGFAAVAAGSRGLRVVVRSDDGDASLLVRVDRDGSSDCRTQPLQVP